LAFVLANILAFLVLLRDHRNPIHQNFALLLIFGGFWDFAIFGMRASPDLSHALAWEKAVLIAISVTAVFLYRFSFAYRHIRLNKVRHLAICLFPILVAIFTPMGLVVSDMQLKSYGYAPVPGPLFYPVAIFFYFISMLALGNLISSYKAATSNREKTWVSYIIIGLSCSLIGGVADVLPIFGLPSYPGAIIGNIIFAILASIAILKYHLLDIHVVIRKSIAYLLISTAVAIPYVGTIFLLTHVLKTKATEPWVYLLLLITTALALQPLWSRIQHLVDRWFYRERYDHLKALERFSQETKDITDLGYLADSLIKLVSQAMRTTKSCLTLLDPKRKHFAVVSSYGLTKHPKLIFRTNSVLINWLRQHGEFLERRELDVLPQLQGITMKERSIINQVGAQLFIPIQTTRGLIGILVLGPKLSEEDYSEDDVKLLTVASHQIANALDNARLYKEAHETLRELQKTQNQLLRVERLRAIGEVAAGVGHDIRNLLTVTLGRAQLALEKVKDNGKLKHDLRVIEQAALDGAEVVNRLQSFTEVGSDLSFELVDMNRILLDALQMIEPRLSQQREIEDVTTEVIVNLGEAEPVKGKPSEIREMLTNILVNAIEAMPGGGKLTLTSRQENDSVVITIEDTGVGIASKVRKGIFEPFYTTKGPQGVGLGLSIAYGMAKKHGGDIAVSSEPGKGSTFAIRLPVTKRKGARQAVSGKVRRATKKGAKALIIDDDKAVGEVLSEILESDGYIVDLARSGKKGLALAKQKDYAVVLTDLGMPGMSGRELAKVVNTVKPAIPIFLVTGWDVQLQPAELIDFGITGVITKPFTKTNVLAQIKRFK
jgi:signal transduction histidine kinase/CheY-like chemotaxis protein